MDSSQWPAEGPVRTWFEYLSRVRALHGMPTGQIVAKKMHLESRSRVSALLRNSLPDGEEQAEALLDALGAASYEKEYALHLYRTIQSIPSDDQASQSSRASRGTGSNPKEEALAAEALNPDGANPETNPTSSIQVQGRVGNIFGAVGHVIINQWPPEQLRDTSDESTAAIRPIRLLPQPEWVAGREGLLAELDIRLTVRGARRPRVVALSGLGGIGKTTVALEYAYRNMGNLGLIWQFAAEDPTLLQSGFDDLSRLLHGRNQSSASDPIAHVHAVLASLSEEWLLIFDNATDHLALQKVLPPAGNGRILITSQNPQWPGNQAMSVPVLSHAAAASFLQTRTSLPEKASALELADELDGLPLAIEQAASYMIATGRSITEYLEIFRNRRSELLARGEPVGYAKQVATTWSLAFDYLKEATPSAISLLRLFACCAPQQIPLHLLLQPKPDLSDNLPDQLRPLLTDALAVDDAIMALRRFSLISAPSHGTVSVHRLVQAVTLAQLPEEQAEMWHQATRRLIDAALPDDPMQPDTWPAFGALLPHAQMALPANSDSMAQLANYLGLSGRYSTARALARQVAEAAAQECGAESLEALEYYGILAIWTGQAGDAAEARDQLTALLPVVERVCGAEHPDTLAAMGNLAYWTGQAGDAVGARDRYAALLPVVERVCGAEHPDTLIIMGNLARWTGEAGDAAGARDQFAALLPIREQVSGAKGLGTLYTRSELANWTGKAGDAAGARDQFAALLPIREQVSGAEHPDTLLALSNLATWTWKAGDRLEARRRYAALVPVMERVLGAEHPSTLITCRDLAHCTGQAGDAGQARDRVRVLLPAIERVLGAHHPETRLARKRFAEWTGDAGDAAGARDEFSTLLRITEQVLGADHPDTLDIRGYLATFTFEAGDTVEARDQFAALLADIVRVQGADNEQARVIREFLSANRAP